MTPALNQLITGAVALAGGDEVAHSGRMWRSVGGRPCPLGWHGCSQTVFEDTVTGEFDYGGRGSLGEADCRSHCTHGMRKPTPLELEELGDA